MARNYSSTAVQTSLSSGITSSATSISVGAVTGWPTAPFFANIDPDTASEEIVLVTNVVGTTFTATRGQAGTTGVAHNAGAVVRHDFTSVDAQEANDHLGASTNVHGLSGGAAVVGTSSTQTLSSKTFNPPSASGVGLTVTGLASQTGDLAQFKNSGGTTLARVDANGGLTGATLSVSGASTLTGAVSANGGLSIDATVRAAFLKTTSTTEHAMTLWQAGTSGTDTASAANIISDNPLTSAVQISGKEESRGTVKITHTKPTGADSGAAALSIDLQGASTAAQGVFVTSTTGGTTGNPITVRHNSRDDFVVKSTGRVAIGIATGGTPAGVLDLTQNDDSTVGLAMTGRATGAQMILLKDSVGNTRFEVNNAGNAVLRATSFHTGTGIQVGSTTADLGGGSGVISVKNATTNPTTNPTGGAILYADGGLFKVRDPNGNVWVVNPTNMAPTLATQETDQATSSTSYVAGATECSLTFKAPPSGKVHVNITGVIQGNNTSTTHAFLGIEVRNGTTSAGSLVQSPDDHQALAIQGASNMGATRRLLVTGLTAGNDYFIRTMLRADAANSVAAFYRELLVEPSLA